MTRNGRIIRLETADKGFTEGSAQIGIESQKPQEQVIRD